MTTDHPLPPEQARELAEIPSVEVISRAAVMLMSAAASASAWPTTTPPPAHTGTSTRRAG